MAFRVLSIDGGGMRGNYTAAYLDTLERSFSNKHKIPQGLDIGKAFQLIVGTSTGAIIACGLSKGVAPSKMVQLYKNSGAEIFPKKLPSCLWKWDTISQLFTRSRFLAQGNRALQSALNQVLGQTTLRQVWDHRRIAFSLNCRKHVYITDLGCLKPPTDFPNKSSR